MPIKIIFSKKKKNKRRKKKKKKKTHEASGFKWVEANNI